MAKIHYVCFDSLSHLPDIVPPDSYLFPQLKKSQKFSTDYDVKAAVDAYFQ